MKLTTSQIIFTACLIPGLALSMPTTSITQQKSSPIENIQLGGGFLNNDKFPLDSICLKSKKNVMKLGIIKNTSMTKRLNKNKQAEMLNLDLLAYDGWGKLINGDEANYLSKMMNDNYSLYFNYQSVVFATLSLDTSDYYGVDALTPSAAAVYNTSPQDFIQTCGDSYIKTLQMGAVLDVTMRVRFSDQEQKNRFEASADIGPGDIFSDSTKLKNALARNHYKGTVEVYAIQKGGAPSNLNDIFKDNSQEHLIRCDLAKIDVCYKALDKIINYAQAHGKWSDKGFANQIKVKNGKLEADSLYPIALNQADIVKYEADFGLNISEQLPSSNVLKARKSLNQLYNDYYEKTFFSKEIIQSSSFKFLSDNLQRELLNNSKKLESNLSIITNGEALKCFLPSTQNSCPDIAKAIESSLDPVDYDPFNLLNGAYFVNINNKWPLVFVRKGDATMDIYNSNLVLQNDIITHDLQLIPATNYNYISLGGGYSSYSNGIQTRYYMGYYGIEDLVYQNPNGLGYSGTTPWNTCVNGNCSKLDYKMEIFPF